MESMHINLLPLETFVEILLKLDGNTLGRCRAVCKSWKECIDGADHLWQICCENELKYSSKVAKRKSGNNCKWYHIYKNLKMWDDLSKFDRNIRDFYKFNTHNNIPALDVNYSVLPLKDTRGIVLYDMGTLKHIPVAVPEKNCIKISNSVRATAILTKSGLLLQRTVDSTLHMSEAFFKANDFVLSNSTLYFYYNRDVYKCDLLAQNLESKLILRCDYDIKQIQYSNKLHLFTDCGKIVNILKDRDVIVKPLKCPLEWIRQIKYIHAIDDNNFVCYSRSLFKIETDKYQHLYLEFPPITALFFYGDLVLIGTKNGEILLYRLSSQKRAIKPIFENLAVLPDGKYAVHIDVCERKTGPVIVIVTFLDVMLMELNFFPHEKIEKTFPENKVFMYKRLLRLRDRLQYEILIDHSALKRILQQHPPIPQDDTLTQRLNETKNAAVSNYTKN